MSCTICYGIELQTTTTAAYKNNEPSHTLDHCYISVAPWTLSCGAQRRPRPKPNTVLLVTSYMSAKQPATPLLSSISDWRC